MSIPLIECGNSEGDLAYGYLVGIHPHISKRNTITQYLLQEICPVERFFPENGPQIPGCATLKSQKPYIVVVAQRNHIIDNLFR